MFFLYYCVILSKVNKTPHICILLVWDTKKKKIVSPLPFLYVSNMFGVLTATVLSGTSCLGLRHLELSYCNETATSQQSHKLEKQMFSFLRTTMTFLKKGNILGWQT